VDVVLGLVTPQLVGIERHRHEHPAASTADEMGRESLPRGHAWIIARSRDRRRRTYMPIGRDGRPGLAVVRWCHSGAVKARPTARRVGLPITGPVTRPLRGSAVLPAPVVELVPHSGRGRAPTPDLGRIGTVE
jgi:hypothetical protein